MTSSPKRRWLSFSLRTMFVVVTIVGVLFGWQLSIVRERKHLLDWAELNGGKINAFNENERSVLDSGAISAGRRNLTSDIPEVRKWLGDKSISTISIPDIWDDQPEFAQIGKLFPESYVMAHATVNFRQHVNVPLK